MANAPKKATENTEEAMLNATAVLGLGAIAGGVMGYLFNHPCDGTTPLCGPAWGAADGIAVGVGAVGLLGAALATIHPGSRSGAYMVAGAALVGGGIGIAAFVQSRQPAPPPAQISNTSASSASNGGAAL